MVHCVIFSTTSAFDEYESPEDDGDVFYLSAQPYRHQMQQSKRYRDKVLFVTCRNTRAQCRHYHRSVECYHARRERNAQHTFTTMSRRQRQYWQKSEPFCAAPKSRRAAKIRDVCGRWEREKFSRVFK